MTKKLQFGQNGIWHMPASEELKARDILCTVLEETKEGVLYLFTNEPIEGKREYLNNRTVTIFKKDFTPFNGEYCPTCNAELPPNHPLKNA